MSSEDESGCPHNKQRRLYMDEEDEPRKSKTSKKKKGKYDDLESGLSKKYVSNLQQRVFHHLGGKHGSNKLNEAGHEEQKEVELPKRLKEKLDGNRHHNNLRFLKSQRKKLKQSDGSDQDVKQRKKKKKHRERKLSKSHKHKRRIEVWSGESNDDSNEETKNNALFEHKRKKKHKKVKRMVTVYSSNSASESSDYEKMRRSSTRTVLRAKSSSKERRKERHKKSKRRRKSPSPASKTEEDSLSITESEEENTSVNSSLRLYSDCFSPAAERSAFQRLQSKERARNSISNDHLQQKIGRSEMNYRRYSDGMVSRSSLMNRETRKRSYVDFKNTSFSVSRDDANDLLHSKELKFHVSSNWSEERLDNARNCVIDNVSSNQPFVDTHCHIDFLFRKLKYNKTYDQYINDSFVKFPRNFEGCIADWCQPSLYHTAESLLRGNSTQCKIWGAFGCHPHFVNSYTQETENTILSYIQSNDKVIAIGEMGLDFSDRFGETDHELQEKVFVKQLKLANKLQVPLVIHCRDADPDLLRVMKQHVPHDTVIHRHCLTTEESEVRGLLDYFPNCYVGFTNLLSNKSAYRARNAATTIPMDRILLETDSPYFIPRCVSEATNGAAKFSHSGMAACVAKEIAVLKNISTEEILKQARRNVTKVYGI